MLSCNPTLQYVNQYKVGTNHFRFDIAAASLSGISLLLVAVLILTDKKLKVHPNKLIAYICLCDSFTFIQFVTRYLICGFGWSQAMNYFYAITVQYPWVYFDCKRSDNFESCWNGAQNHLKNYGEFDHTVQQRLAAWYFTTIFVSYTSLFLNTTVIYDLKKVINNPFQSSEKRIKKYLVISSIAGLFFCSVGLKITESKNPKVAEWNFRLY